MNRSDTAFLLNLPPHVVEEGYEEACKLGIVATIPNNTYGRIDKKSKPPKSKTKARRNRKRRAKSRKRKSGD